MSCARSARSPRSMPHPSPWCSAAAPRWRARTGWSAECPRMWISRSCRCRRRRSAAAACIASAARCAAVSRRRCRRPASLSTQRTRRRPGRGTRAATWSGSSPTARQPEQGRSCGRVVGLRRQQQVHEQRRRGQERHWAEAFRRRPTVSRRRAARPGNRARVASAGDQGTRAVLAVRVMVSSDCSVRDTRSAWDCAGHRGNLELPHGPLRPSATAGCRTHAFPAAATGRAGQIPALSARCTRGRRKCCLC